MLIKREEKRRRKKKKNRAAAATAPIAPGGLAQHDTAPCRSPIARRVVRLIECDGGDDGPKVPSNATSQATSGKSGADGVLDLIRIDSNSEHGRQSLNLESDGERVRALVGSGIDDVEDGLSDERQSTSTTASNKRSDRKANLADQLSLELSDVSWLRRTFAFELHHRARALRPATATGLVAVSWGTNAPRRLVTVAILSLAA